MWLLAILVFVGTIPFLRLAHELGFALVARLMGARIDRFLLGVGPRVTKLGRLDVRWIPVWAWVTVARPAPMAARIGGSAAGLGFAYVALAVPVFVHMLAGWPTHRSTGVVGHVPMSMPAHEAGLRPGDRMVSIDGEPVAGADDVMARISPNPGREIEVEVERDGERRRFRVIPESVEGRSIIGIVLKTERVLEPMGPAEAAAESLEFHPTLWSLWIGAVVRSFAMSSDLTGPVGMGRTIPSSEDAEPSSLVVVVAIMLSSPFAALALLLHLVLPFPGFAPHRIWKLGRAP